MNTYFPQGRVSDLVVRELPDETLVYDLNTNKASCLNKSAALIWQLCDGTKSPSEIALIASDQTKELLDEYFVELALERLEIAGLIQNPTHARLSSLSRRKAILAMGLMTAALPAVTLVIAPFAAHAQSGGPAPTGTCFASPGGGVISCSVGDDAPCNATVSLGGTCPDDCFCSGAVCIPNGGFPCCTGATGIGCA